MNIYVIASVGTGNTLLSAFDNALLHAGAHNYNILMLSSVIPPGSKITKTKAYKTSQNEWGHKLYVVKAEIRSREAGKYIAAGLGWYQIDDGRGLFVEHEEKGETQEAVQANLESEIRKSIIDLCKTRKLRWEKKRFHMLLSITQVTNSPTCAMVVAVYESEGWKSV